MILRKWMGVAKPEEADRYLEHLKTVTFPEVSKIRGFLRANVTKRFVEQGVEFLVLSEWESEEAIKEFAGDDAEAAVVPGQVQAMMASFDHYATHYEVVHRHEGRRGMNENLQE